MTTPDATADAAYLPYGRQVIDEEDISAVVDVLRGDWLTSGPAVAAFEAAFSACTDGAHAVAVSSGTAALHIAALALGLGPGDAAVVPSITFLATANAVLFTGADVIFADVDPNTGLMEASDLDAALARAGDAKVKAVFPVHLAGQTPDMAPLTALARTSGLKIVEDACHSVGGAYHDASGATKPIGGCAHSDMTVFSFHPVKTIAMGEGGLVSCTDDGLAERLRSLRSHGMTHDAGRFANADMAFAADGSTNPWYYEMGEPGFNYRASDIHCALGLSQLEKLEHFVETRRNFVALYDELIEPLAPVIRPLGRSPGCRPGWHLYIALIDFQAAGIDRAEVMNRLKDQGIGTQVHYIPVHQQPYYQDRYGKTTLPGAEAYYERCLSLPLYPGMKNHDVERVVNAITNAIGF